MNTQINFPDKNDFILVQSVKFTFEDIHNVVDLFYTRVQIDDHLHGPFGVVDDWPYHIEKLTHFWWFRFGGRPYMDVSYNPVEKHFETGFSERLLEVWLELFKDVLEETLTPEQARLWYMFAEGIGGALNRNNEFMKMQMKK